MDPQVGLPSIKEVITDRLPHFPRVTKRNAHHIRWLEDILCDFRRALVDSGDDITQFLSDYFSCPRQEDEPIEAQHLANIKDAWDHPEVEDSPDHLYDVHLSRGTFLSKLLAICAHVYETSENPVADAKSAAWAYVVSYITCNPDLKPGVKDTHIDQRIMRDAFLARAFPRAFTTKMIQTVTVTEMIPDVTNVHYYPIMSKRRVHDICKIIGKTTPDFRDAARIIASNVASFHYCRGVVILVANGNMSRTHSTCDYALLERVANAAELGELIEKCLTPFVLGVELAQAKREADAFREAVAQLPDRARFEMPFWKLIEAVLYRLCVSVPERDYASLYRYVDRLVVDPIIDLPVRLIVDHEKALADLELTDMYGESRASGDTLEFAQALFAEQ